MENQPAPPIGVYLRQWPPGRDVTGHLIADYPGADVIPAHPANYGFRPPGGPIDAVVLHATAGSQAATVAWFRNPKAKVSSHYVIGRQGRIIQMVPESYAAWHAGLSEYDGRTNWNQFSIGIELVNKNDGKDAYWIGQIQALITLLRYLHDRYTILPQNVVTHAQISKHLTGKTDPRGLPVATILHYVYEAELPAPTEVAHEPAQ